MATDAFALRDEDSQGRWNKPCTNGPDAVVVPGFLVNMGPTGARGIFKARAYKYLMDHPGGLSSQGRCVATLAMLSSDDRKVFAVGKHMAQE